MGNLKDAARLIAPDVEAAIGALKLGDADKGAAQLAREYARTIDLAGRHCAGCDDPECSLNSAQWAMRWIAPLLLDALESLGATPAARARQQKGGKPDAAPGQLARLRTASTQGRRA